VAEVLISLAQLPDSGENNAIAPYLEVLVLLEGPEPGLRHKIETALIGKHVRLAKIDSRYPTPASSSDHAEIITHEKLEELQPADLFAKVYQSRYGNTVPIDIQQLFTRVAQEVSQTENT
jgi:exonuclease SbcD